MRRGSTSHLNRCAMSASVSATATPWYGCGKRACHTSAGNGPKPALYGATLPVSAIAIIDRPWNPPLNAITPGRPVA